MALVRLNEADTQGYSICWNNFLVAMSAHRRDSPRTSLESQIPHEGTAGQTDFVWLYLPMDPGEVITQIWYRNSGPYRKLDGLMVSLSDIYLSSLVVS